MKYEENKKIDLYRNFKQAHVAIYGVHISQSPQINKNVITCLAKRFLITFIFTKIGQFSSLLTSANFQVRHLQCESSLSLCDEAQ